MQQRAQSYLNVKCFKSAHPLKLLLNNRIFASCKIKKKDLTCYMKLLQTMQLKSVWFLFVFTLTCWYEGRRCFALGNLLLLSATLELNVSSLGCFSFCVTTGSRGAIYKCHLSNTFCTHVATCHPTSLLHCGNSPVTGTSWLSSDGTRQTPRERYE